MLCRAPDEDGFDLSALLADTSNQSDGCRGINPYARQDPWTTGPTAPAADWRSVFDEPAIGPGGMVDGGWGGGWGGGASGGSAGATAGGAAGGLLGAIGGLFGGLFG